MCSTKWANGERLYCVDSTAMLELSKRVRWWSTRDWDKCSAHHGCVWWIAVVWYALILYAKRMEDVGVWCWKKPCWSQRDVASAHLQPVQAETILTPPQSLDWVALGPHTCAKMTASKRRKRQLKCGRQLQMHILLRITFTTPPQSGNWRLRI